MRAVPRSMAVPGVRVVRQAVRGVETVRLRRSMRDLVVRLGGVTVRVRVGRSGRAVRRGDLRVPVARPWPASRSALGPAGSQAGPR